MENPNAQTTPDVDSAELLGRFALIRLRRFERLAAVAEESGSALWRELARSAARAAYRDYLLLGMAGDAGAALDPEPTDARAGDAASSDQPLDQGAAGARAGDLGEGTALLGAVLPTVIVTAPSWKHPPAVRACAPAPGRRPWHRVERCRSGAPAPRHRRWEGPMKLTDVRLIPVRLRCHDVPSLSHWHSTTRYHTIVRLDADDGARGWGEASGLGEPSALGPDPRRLEALLRDELAGADARDVVVLGRRLRARLGDTPLARQVRCGVDLALHDLVGRARGESASRLLGGAARSTLRVAYAIGAHRRVEDVPASIAYIGERLARGFDLIRAYIGLDAAADDLFMAQLGETYGGRVRIKTLDCNGHLEAKAALRAIDRYREHEPLLVESPVRRGDLAGLAEVRRRIRFPVSEHVDGPADALALVRAGAVDVMNLRCISLGGLVVAREVAAIAEAAGLACVIGAAHEVNLGTAGQVHLGATLAGHDFPADCIGPETYLEDVTSTLLRYEGSTLHVPTDPGLGFVVDEARLAEHTVARPPGA
ncbi:MAG TPA: enolase C-terminal domain-like protein [Chloroflexota bacterium]|jgi:muconate cycloisomerase